MRATQFILALCAASTACYGTAFGMGITIYNDSNTSLHALLTADHCNYPNPQITIQPNASGNFNNLEKYHCLTAGRVYLSHYAMANVPGQPLGGRYQLVEYTFSLDHTPTVDYDFSAVDSLDTIPLAVEAVDPVKPGDSIGWTGMSPQQSQPVLQQKMDTFMQAQGNFPGWPHMAYKDSSGNIQPNLSKIPGGYNLFALTSPSDLDQTVAAQTRNYLIKRWYAWYNNQTACTAPLTNTQCQAIHQSVVDVINAFTANAKANGQANPTPEQIIEHITGYASFGDTWQPITTQTAEEVIGLLSGVPTKSAIHDPAYQSIVYPAADQPNAFDPFVSFIHKSVGLNVYAFSIDDAIGNLYVPGYQGIAIDVGGINHLPNKQRYADNTGAYSLNMGAGWGTSTASVCGTSHTYNNGGIYQFNIDTSCAVNIKNPNINFTLVQDKTSPASPKPIHVENCSGAGQLCQQINIDGSNIDLPGGTGPA